MGKSKTDHLKKKRRMLMERLAAQQDMIRGSLVKTHKKCGRKGCRCESGELHPHTYLSSSGKSGNTIVYARQEEEAAFKRGIAAYRRTRSILEQISRVNIEIIKEDEHHER